MTTSAISRVVEMFMAAFRDLSIQVPIEDVERLAIVVYHSMQHGRRTYHRTAHVFDLAGGLNARQTLAVLFHDIVYYQVDGGFPEKAKAMLDTVVRADDGRFILLPNERRDSCTVLCNALFGFEDGEPLSLGGGLNEYLSAIIATRLLRPYLTVADLVAIASCIEATIPFRGRLSSGETVFERAEARVQRAGEMLHAGLTQGDVERIVTDAVVVANRDVRNFSVDDQGRFLATMWQLIEESNASLYFAGAYSIQEYRRALMGMEQFVVSLNPDHVFHGYRGTPGDGELAALQAAARKNLEFARCYLSAKIVSMALLEALAFESGGDCPVTMMLGDIQRPDGVPEWIEGLPSSLAPEYIDPAVLTMLETGRPGSTAFDLTTSPLAAHIYRREGHEGTIRALAHAKQMFAGHETPLDFLATLRPELVRRVAGSCARMAPSREARLRALEARF